MTPGVLASLFDDNDDDGDGEWFQRNADPPRPSTMDDGDAGATDTGVNKRHRRSLSSHSERRAPSSSRRRREPDEADIATVSTRNDDVNDDDDNDDSTSTGVPPTPKRKSSATLRVEISNPSPRRSSHNSDKGDVEPSSRLRKSSASRLSTGKQRNGGDAATAAEDPLSGRDSDGEGEKEAGVGDGEREGTTVVENGAEGEAEETGVEQRRDSGGNLNRRPKGPGPIVMNASHVSCCCCYSRCSSSPFLPVGALAVSE